MAVMLFGRKQYDAGKIFTNGKRYCSQVNLHDERREMRNTRPFLQTHLQMFAQGKISRYKRICV